MMKVIGILVGYLNFEEGFSSRFVLNKYIPDYNVWGTVEWNVCLNPEGTWQLEDF